MDNSIKWTPETFVTEAMRVIPKTPKERVTQHVREIIEKGQGYVHDVHVHTFDKDAINEGYFVMKFMGEKLRSIFTGQKMMPLANDEDFAVQQLMEELNVSDLEDFYDKYETEKVPDWEELKEILEQSQSQFEDFQAQQKGLLGAQSVGEFLWFVLSKFYPAKSQEEMLQFYYESYSLTNIDPFKDKKMIASVLMMDFYKEFAGRFPRRKLVDQIADLNKMANKYAVLPFLALDPRRVADPDSSENLYDLFLTAFDPAKEGRFFGVKLYPSLGYSVSDYRLKPFYKVCAELGIPVVSHCGGEMVSTFDKEIEIYYDLDETKMRTISDPQRVNRIRELNSPSYFVSVMKEFPNLKLNIAHFGGNEAWIKEKKGDDLEPYRERVKIITDLMLTYSGVYTDFSYCLTDRDTYEKLKSHIANNKTVMDRLMYGTDYWVVLFTKGKRFMKNLDAFVSGVFGDKDLMTKMVTTNPDRYLFEILPNNNRLNVDAEM